MSELKHTPGPWKYFKRENTENSTIPFGIHAPQSGATQPIFDTAAFPPNNEPNLIRMEADAKLATAAPDMFELITELANMHPDGNPISLIQKAALLLKQLEK